MENKKFTANWDKMQSTFYWQINLNPNFPHNHVKYLRGYSKVISQRENADKNQLLKNKIIMFYQNDFLNANRVECIEIWQRLDEIINTKTDPKILILYPDKYQAPAPNEINILKTYGDFLNRFYEIIKKQGQKDFSTLTGKVKRIRSNDDFLNPDIKTFKSIQQLYSYSVNLLKYGHAPGQVEQFIFKVKQKNDWLNIK